LVLAFTIAVILDRPATRSRSPAATSGEGEATPSASGFAGAALPAGVRARDFTLAGLTAPSGRRNASVSLSSYRGRVVVLAFLYSTCGPTCTLIAQQIRGALDVLPQPTPVLIVSADPSADTAARVHDFLARVSLTGRVHYLIGSRAELRAVWRAYGAVPASAGRVAFDDAAAVLLIDSRGFERVLFPVEQLTPEALAHDIGKLQAG
jgi:protein SCO1/2